MINLKKILFVLIFFFSVAPVIFAVNGASLNFDKSTVTVAPARKAVPVMVIEAPPAVGPLLGETLVTVGGAK